MDEVTFDKVGRAELADLEEKLEQIDPDDIDLDTIDGVLTLTLSDGVRIVTTPIGRRGQIWMAAVASAWHFDPPSGTEKGWRTPKNDELRATLTRVVRERIGLELEL